MEKDKKERVTEELIDIFDRINIQTPSNFEKILEFVYNDVKDSDLDELKESVAFAFKKWIENKN